MPLNTEIQRDGEPLKLRWSDFHVAAMIVATAYDSGEGPFKDNSEPPVQTSTSKEGITQTGHFISRSDAFNLAVYHVIGTTPLNNGAYTLKHNYTFIDCTDGEELHLQPGDVLKMWRTSSR